MMTMEDLEGIKKQFWQYKQLGEKTFEQLTDAQLFWKYNEESNSIATIVKHLWGNMKSRWTDFLTTDGEKENRNRDSEFEEDIKDRAELLTKWNEGWECLWNALDALDAQNMQTTVYIRNQAHTVTEAIIRQLAHYPYHIGQIVYVGKMAKAEAWNTLSIPRGKSEIYNAEKFSRPT